MARKDNDFFAQIREQGERALALLTSEIRKREAELEKLLEQARLWRETLARSPSPARTRASKRSRRSAATPRPAQKVRHGATSSRKKKRSSRVDWDAVRASLPATFTIDDVMKTPGGKAKGRNQVYPAINRWMKAKKVRKVGPGRYKKTG